MADNNSSSGIGFLGVLFIAFLVLKLTGVIDWSWWFITMPLWGIPVILLLVIGVAFITEAFDGKEYFKKPKKKELNGKRGRMEQWIEKQRAKKKEI